ncbi:MAG: DUF2760 domain-containing protein [Burkholderiales bacterium]|nr:DUF2760 domain-containing protein [Burkholderiales bacterium]
MTVLIAALAACLLSALNFLPADTLPASSGSYLNAGVILLTLFIAWQSVVASRSRQEPSTPAVQPPPPVAPPKPAKPEPTQTGEALILLSLLQEKGRFLDYVTEDITAFNDAQVAAASRVVHQGCSAVIKECLALSPTHEGKEGDRITLDKSSDPNRYRLLGKVPQEPPYQGVVVHRGWQTTKLALPRFTRPVDPTGPNVITPMDVEVR